MKHELLNSLLIDNMLGFIPANILLINKIILNIKFYSLKLLICFWVYWNLSFDSIVISKKLLIIS
jgi:hypothetical protein